jgi:hypothetical protein
MAVNRLSGDRRIFVMGCVSLGGGCLWFLVPVTLAVLAGSFHSDQPVSDAFFHAAVIAVPTLFLLWIALHVAFRLTFYRDAVRAPGQGPPGGMPRVLDAPAGVISGEPELVLKMQTRCSFGKLGTCLIELYSDGLQISRGPQHPEPRWQFPYRDLLQAESVDLVSSGAKGTSVSQRFVRVITDQPRMVFLFGTNLWWLQNQKAQLLVTKLREHQVPTFAESLDA